MGDDYVTSKQFDEFLHEEREHHDRSEAAGNKRGEQINEIYRKLDSIDRWRVRNETLINRHEHTLYGNGEPGMDEMLRELHAWMVKQKEREETTNRITKEELRKYLFWIITFVAALLLNSWITELLAK